MPFTFAHPVAIIPINKRWKDKFCLTGLVLGSMSPDFEYFIHLRPFSTYGHNILGFFILNLPLSFFLAYMFHYVLKNPLILHMPSPIDKWFSNFLYRSWNLSSIKKVLIFVYSALLGMLTNVIWDSFTHADGMMVSLLPVLSLKFFAFGYSVAIYKLLQHGGSLIGILIIMIILYKSRNQKVIMHSLPVTKKLLFFILTLLFNLFLIFGIIYIKQEPPTIFNMGAVVVIMIDCLFLGLVLTSVISRLWLLNKKT